jgi:hypothetical protein
MEATTKGKPTIFMGSSGSESAKAVLQEIVKALAEVAETNEWSRPEVLEMNAQAGDSVLKRTQECDFGLFLLTPDDIVISKRDDIPNAVLKPRANVILEMGMFFGSLGKERVFVVVNTEKGDLMPSDFKGDNIKPYSDTASLVEATHQIANLIKQRGFRSPTHKHRKTVLDDLTQLANLAKLPALTREPGFLAATRIITDPHENYAIAKGMITRGITNRMLMYETTNSDNEPHYEQHLLDTIRAHKPTEGTPLLRRIISSNVMNDDVVAFERTVSETPSLNWVTHRRSDEWQHDLLVNKPQRQDGGTPEALIGIAARSQRDWLAIHITATAAVECLAATCASEDESKRGGTVQCKEP